MKKLLISLFALAVPSLCFSANSSLTVSSGTFLAVDGFLPANNQFRQAIVIADPNSTGNTTVVDSSGNLHVLISTYTTLLVNSQQTGTYTETPGSGTWSVSGTFFQTNQPVSGLGTFAVVPASGTFPVSVSTPYQVFLSSFGVNASTSVVAPMTGAVFPVSGTFFQTLQPVQVLGSVGVTPTTGTFPVSGVGQFTITMGTGTLTEGPNTGQLTVTPGTGTFPISGSISVNFLSTATVAGTTPTVVDMIGGVGVSGTATQFRLDASSSVFVATHAVTVLNTVAVTPSSGTYPVSATFGLPVTSTYTSEGSWTFGVPVTSTYTSEGSWTSAVPVTSTQTLSAATTMYVLNQSSVSAAVGYFVGAGSVPVNVLNTLTVNTHAVNEGVWTFGIPVTSTYTSEGSWTFAIPTTSTYTVVVSTQGDNQNTAANDKVTTISGIYHHAYFDSNTAATAGRNAAESIMTDGTLATSIWPAISTATYFASTNTFTIFNSTQDSTWLKGPTNANMMNELMYLTVSCQQTTAGLVDIAILKRSTGYTGAYSTMTATPADSNYGITQSSANFSTAAGLTNGTLVGDIDNQLMGCNSSAGLNNDIYILPSQLRGTIDVRSGEVVAVNFLNASMSGAKLVVSWVWREVAAIKP